VLLVNPVRNFRNTYSHEKKKGDRCRFMVSRSLPHSSESSCNLSMLCLLKKHNGTLALITESVITSSPSLCLEAFGRED
jgi:hypothetical protein